MRLLLLFLVAIGSAAHAADPMTFKEVSLLVRMQVPQSEIVAKLNQRKLIQPLTEQELETVRAQGAQAELLAALRDARLHLSSWDAKKFLARKDAELRAIKENETEIERNAPVAVVAKPAPPGAWQSVKLPVAWGAPISLATLGGPNVEISVKSRVAHSYMIEVVKREKIIPVAKVYVPDQQRKASPTRPAAPEPPEYSTERTRIRVEKRDPITLINESAPLYLLYSDAASGMKVYYADDRNAPINTDYLVVTKP
jgi:hypothetical protein